MKNLFLICTLLFTAFILSTCQQEAAIPSGSESEEIMALENRWLEVDRSNDIDASREYIRDVYDDDCLFTMEGFAHTKDDLLNAEQNDDVETVHLSTSDVRLRLYGDTAVVTGMIHKNIRIRGQVIQSPNRYTRVYKKTGTNWKLIAYHMGYSVDVNKVINSN